MISTVILKPTKNCNADCSYCSAPPDHEASWTIDEFKLIFDKLERELDDYATLLFHGGEPMLMGVDFYTQAWEYVHLKKPNVSFSMQSNLLLYSNKWKPIFENIFKGSISTSYDPDEKDRTVNGSSEKYTKMFFKKINRVLEDGFKPLVIGTYTNDTIHLVKDFYEKSKSHPSGSFSIRINYRFPAGRISELEPLLLPETYGKVLIELYDKWITELPDLHITPLDQMFLKVMNVNMSQCPWTKRCGGSFMAIEPNGDVYNCGEFADLNKEEYRYGNIRENWVPGGKKMDVVNLVKIVSPQELASKMLNSNAARLMKQRTYNLPKDCITCRHFKECEGGCMRDAELYDRGLGGKFFYCESWKMVFDHIKESVISGKADQLMKKYGFDVSEKKAYVLSTIGVGT